MTKLIPFEKLSKKEQKKRNAANRGSWGNIKPVTRKSENPKAYNRRKARNAYSDSGYGVAGFSIPRSNAHRYPYFSISISKDRTNCKTLFHR